MSKGRLALTVDSEFTRVETWMHKQHFVPLYNASGLPALFHRRNRLSSLGKDKQAGLAFKIGLSEKPQVDSHVG